MFYSCVLILWFSSWVFYIGLIWSYGSSKRTELTFGQWKEIVSLGGAVLDVYLFLLKYFGHDTCLWLLWRILMQSCSLVDFFLMNKGPTKGQLYSFPSCYINNYITPLLLSTNPIQYYFRYGIDEALDLWKDMGWYC